MLFNIYNCLCIEVLLFYLLAFHHKMLSYCGIAVDENIFDKYY